MTPANRGTPSAFGALTTLFIVALRRAKQPIVLLRKLHSGGKLGMALTRR